MRGDLLTLEAAIGHTFRDRELLERALTHKSHAHEQNGDLNGAPRDPSGDNEQLEFLGDSILGFVASEYLVRRNPEAPEGRLSKLKAHLVSAAHLHEAAQALGLGNYLFLGRGEEMSGGREKKALLADALEAVIAALYLDAGLPPARSFIETRVLSLFDISGEGMPSAATDHKSALQETAQALKLPPPRYVIVGEEGPEHSKTFTVEVRVGKDWVSQAQGSSKKAAGQKAAQHILQQLTEWGR
jgi:ribonuclease III